VEPVLKHPSDAYRRTARRLRGRLDGKPGELYRSLRDLSDDYDDRFTEPARREIPRPSSPADDFAAQITGKIRDGVLCYSDRLELLKTAGQLGISRFDANLIIAAVQHRVESNQLPEPLFPKRPLPAVDLVAAFLVVQILILFMAWVVFTQ
jgi:hypothetical protein